MGNSKMKGMNQNGKNVFLGTLLPTMLLLAAGFFIGDMFITAEYKENLIGWGSVHLQTAKLKACEVQCRPPGSKSLPKGFVSHTSDLEMRQLWDPQRNTNQKPMSLLAMAVGIKQKESVNEIVMKFPSTDFVVMLFHYDGIVNDWSVYEWSERIIHVSAIGQTKWWFAKRFLHPDIVSVYSYIFLWDEDIGVENFDPIRYISIIKEEGLEISQPALDPNKSEVHHKITARNSTSRVHWRTFESTGKMNCNGSSIGPPCSGFVEMMAPVISKASWQCTWYMIQSDMKYGWGVDFQLSYCAQGDPTKNIGIVDAEYIVHYGLPTLGDPGVNKTEAKIPDEAAKNAPPQASPGRTEAVKQAKIEFEAFKNRWKRAVEGDNCWIDSYPQN